MHRYFIIAVILFLIHASSFSQRIEPSKESYTPEETITVNFYDFPGTNDWITIVPLETPADKYDEWQYTNQEKNGTMNFKGLPPGRYQIRAYFNWPDNGYLIEKVYTIAVGTVPPQLSLQLKTDKNIYKAGEQVKVDYWNFPSTNDWITLVPREYPADKYLQWNYTNQNKEGSLLFQTENFAPGSYEVRAYLNWPEEGYKIYKVYTIWIK